MLAYVYRIDFIEPFELVVDGPLKDYMPESFDPNATYSGTLSMEVILFAICFIAV